MPKVTFLPVNRAFEVQEGKTILEAAVDNGIFLQHSCGGFCACSSCHVIVKSGEDSLSKIEECEEEMLERATDLTIHSRLGCQAKIHGDVIVQVVKGEK